MNASRNVQANAAERFFNKTVAFITARGFSLYGSRVLAVRGRVSGEWRTTPVNLLTREGARYLVAPRGHTQWVRNIRAAGGGELRLGRKTETFTVTELDDAEKLPVLRDYLARWGWEVGRFFDEDIKNITDDRLAALAPGLPVFRIN